MRRSLATLAAVLALSFGAFAGTYGSRLVVGRLAAQSIAEAGWTEIDAEPTSPNILTRALHVLRDPAGFPADTIRTFATTTDSDGRALAGGSLYVLRLAADTAPPAGSWSLSTLDADGRLPASNAPVSVGSGSADLHLYADGSVDVLVQATPPDDPTANWLPAPPGSFQLMVRLYAPKAASQRWHPPRIERRETAA